MTADDPRTLVSLGCRVLGMMGLSDLIWGHISVRDPDGRGVWIKAGGLGFDEIGEEQVLLVDREGNLLEGSGRVHLEYPIHTEVLAARPDATSVVHTHGEAAVTFGATGAQLRPIGHEGALFSPPGPARYTETSDLIRTPAMGASVAECLADRNALLLVNHGVVTAGADVPTAVLTAIFLEKACRMQLQAAAAGDELSWTSDSEAVAKRGRVYGPGQIAAAWDYLVRRLPPVRVR
jgi:L-fuculose-phosphate aldolase